MLNKLAAFIRRYSMITVGDTVICAVSGGADSMALLWSMYLLRDKLGITLAAAHYNHGLRGLESDADAEFVKNFCHDYGIPLYMEKGSVQPGKKGLEAAARDARYAFFRTLPGKIATAHTADDNAETVLMHMVRGTGLKGLGGIAPVRDGLFRPMLTVTRQQVLDFLAEYSIPYVNDSTNATDAFLRNRLRHHVMPLLKAENPRLSESLTEMALNLRQDEAALAGVDNLKLPNVETLRQMEPAHRSRYLRMFLKQCGVREPEREHIALAESLVFSHKPSAQACFPGGIVVCREYDQLRLRTLSEGWEAIELPCPGLVQIGRYTVRCKAAERCVRTRERFTVQTVGKVFLRPRRNGDEICLSGGTRSLKKLFIDRKIPADQREQIPVICDEVGIIGVCGVGADMSRCWDTLPAMEITIEICE